MSDAKGQIANLIESAPPAKSSGKTKPKRAGEMPYDTDFPDGCPVEPLGINGDDVYFLDQKRQLRVLKAEKLNQGTIRTLFGELDDLKYAYWPRYSKPNEDGIVKVVGWRPEQAADCLYSEAARRGIWDVLDRVRGPGCWLDEDGKLVMHSGDLLFHDGRALEPGQIGRHVYPSAPAKPHPEISQVSTDPAHELLTLLKTWNWRRPEVDPYLLLGWITAAMLGGALKWRPLIWITGDKATGKSSLHDVLKHVMGPGGMVGSTDATAASLWQTVGHASLPVALDEIEAEADNRKAQNIIKLARHAASGGQTLRGGSDHKNAAFTVRSCFLFSSILIPPMLGQDVSRMAILALDPLPKDQPALDLEPRRLAEIGRALRGRLLQHWHRGPRVMQAWQMALGRAGHGGRGADQFGTLLACQDLVLYDYDTDTDAEYMAEWSRLLDKATLAECEDDIADHERCVSYLLTAQLDLFRSGERRTVGSWIVQAAGRDTHLNSDSDVRDANRALGNVGIIVQDKVVAPGAAPFKVVCFANDHNGLAQLFRESHWAGQSGTNGVWVQALRRVKGAFADQQRFGGIKKRCTAVPIDSVIGGKDD